MENDDQQSYLLQKKNTRSSSSLADNGAPIFYSRNGRVISEQRTITDGAYSETESATKCTNKPY